LADGSTLKVVGRAPIAEEESRKLGQFTRATADPHGALASRSASKNNLGIASPILAPSTGRTYQTGGKAGANQRNRLLNLCWPKIEVAENIALNRLFVG